jgi:formamidopyrimidine-DNA glycosylase
VPELLEVEAYRRLAEDRAVGRKVLRVVADDPWYLKRGLDQATVMAALENRRVVGARRVGKLLLLDTDGPTLGLRFGMTGRLVIDESPGVDRLLYSTNASNPAFDRFALRLGRGPNARPGWLVMRDPRRLGGVELDPDVGRLGPDAVGLKPAELRRILGVSSAPLKARLLDQSRLAGVGNLIADEALWRAGLDPARPAGGLTDAEIRRLATALRRTVSELGARGGSHTGDLMSSRAPGGLCPRDGSPLIRRQVGGRTTWSCPAHQR